MSKIYETLEIFNNKQSLTAKDIAFLERAALYLNATFLAKGPQVGNKKTAIGCHFLVDFKLDFRLAPLGNHVFQEIDLQLVQISVNEKSTENGTMEGFSFSDFKEYLAENKLFYEFKPTVIFEGKPKKIVIPIIVNFYYVIFNTKKLGPKQVDLSQLDRLNMNDIQNPFTLKYSAHKEKLAAKALFNALDMINTNVASKGFGKAKVNHDPVFPISDLFLRLKEYFAPEDRVLTSISVKNQFLYFSKEDTVLKRGDIFSLAKGLWFVFDVLEKELQG